MRGHGAGEPEVIETNHTWQDAMRVTQQLLLRRDRPTAITYENDIMAAAGLKVAREIGINVPRDLSIVAGDDSQLCVLVRPALTALSWDVTAFGAHTARILMNLVDGNDSPSFEDSAPQLTVRGSTSAPTGR